jgi:hypothetical protein
MKLKRFSTEKAMVTRLKSNPTEWEKNLFQLYIRKGINKHYIQGAQKKKNKLPKNE